MFSYSPGCYHVAYLLMGTWAFFVWFFLHCINGFNFCCSLPLLCSYNPAAPLSCCLIRPLTCKVWDVCWKADPVVWCWQEELGEQENADFSKRGPKGWGCRFRNWNPKFKWQTGILACVSVRANSCRAKTGFLQLGLKRRLQCLRVCVCVCVHACT